MSKAGTGTPGPATFYRLRTPSVFQARTIILSQGVWTGFSSPMRLEVKFGTGATPA